MKKLITLLVLVLSSAIGFGQPTSNLVTSTRVSVYNDNTEDWDRGKRNYPSDMYVVISDLDITVNGKKPTTIRMTKGLSDKYTDDYRIFRFEGYNIEDNSEVEVRFFYKRTDSTLSSMVVFSSYKDIETALEFNFN